MTNPGDITGLDTLCQLRQSPARPSRTNDHRSGSTPFAGAAVTVVGLDLTESPPMERISSVRAAAAAWDRLGARARWVIAWPADA